MFPPIVYLKAALFIAILPIVRLPPVASETRLELTVAIPDVLKYGVNGEKNVTSTFMGKELPSPVLNISIFSVPTGILQILQWQNILETKQASMRWMYEDTMYSQDYMMEMGKCQANLVSSNHLISVEEDGRTLLSLSHVKAVKRQPS